MRAGLALGAAALLAAVKTEGSPVSFHPVTKEIVVVVESPG